MNRLFPGQFQVSFTSWLAFLATIGLFSLLLGVLVTTFGYQGSFLLTHRTWGACFDAAMPHLTHLADGATVGGLLVMLRVRKQPGVMFALLLSLVLVLVAVNVLKQQVFPEWDRPAMVFETGQVRLLSLGMEKYFSFPSGHSTAAACLGWFIASAGSRYAWGVMSALVAMFLAWTRVYIGVHFPGDVLAGLLLGTSLAILGTWLSGRLFEAKPVLMETSWLRPVLFAGGVFLFIGGIISLMLKYYL